MKEEDVFSTLARQYSLFRPHYPDSLIQYLTTIVSARDLALDCGTGNGQVAAALSGYFKTIWAIDRSENQIRHAQNLININYRITEAEKTLLPAKSADLVTSAQAVHWFNLDEFYKEVKRVLKPGGVIALWGYHLPEISRDIDRILHKYYYDIVGSYWSHRIKLVNERYKSIAFPFHEINTPEFYSEHIWDLNELTGFLRSWSATQKYFELNKEDPLMKILGDLEDAWGNYNLKRLIRWPLFLRAGRL